MMVDKKHSICTIFLFNHKFEENIKKIEDIYESRFSIRKYIMPFSSYEDDKILRVYESSWNFSGHIAQASSGFIDSCISHYVFIADDLILNPYINEDNILRALALDGRSGYIKSLETTNAIRYRWPWSGETAMSLRKFGRGFDYRKELPHADDARSRFEKMGLVFDDPLPRSIRDLYYSFIKLPKKSPWAFLMGLGVFGQSPEYPLLSGYADFFVVPADAIRQFVHYCGVFAAMNIFAEVAVPTALALAVDNVVTELEFGQHFMDGNRRNPNITLKGMEFWDPLEAYEYAKSMDLSRERLIRDFPVNWLYVHPVKLSQFK